MLSQPSTKETIMNLLRECKRLFIFGTFLFVFVLSNYATAWSAANLFSATGSLGTARDQHTATLLPNGKVLVTGGLGDGGVLYSAEVYDPATGSFSATGSLGVGPDEHKAAPPPTRQE